MRKTKGFRLVALALILTMLVPNTAYAARPSWGNYRQNWWNNFTPTTTTTTTETETEMEVVESAETVENAELLRASTYEVTTTETTTTTTSTWGITRDVDTETASSTSTVKYFPVTMYDYDGATINAATDALDPDGDLTVREGLYFSDGGSEIPTTKETVTDFSAFVEGQYYIQNIRAKENSAPSWLFVYSDNSIRGTADKEEATLWTLVIENDEYYLMSGDKYLLVGTDGNTDGLTATKTPITISSLSGNASCVQLSQDGYYLNHWGGGTSIYYGAHNTNNDYGNGMLFYPVDSDGNVSDNPIAPVTETTITSGYEEWNHWNKNSGDNANGDLIYTGLVQDKLIDDQIVFNVNEGGIFNNDTDVKDIYEYVGLPFTVDENGVYSFDSDENGAYFADTDADGAADPQSGTKDAPYNLYFAEGTTQMMFEPVGDGSMNAWFPYNIEHDNTYTAYDGNTYGSYSSGVNHHFGMRADVPFSMTENGCVKSTDDESDAITFTFSGDDDVWVFVDGHLVIDLGGIHNRLDATIDFAANTITYSENNAQDSNNETRSYNDSTFMTVQKLFADTEVDVAEGVEVGGEGIIKMSRQAFALDEDHEMSVFYLERGKGTSNCRIEFNLPMNDSVIVTKDATKSWSQAAEDADIAKDPDMEDPGVDSLTANEQAIVNNIDFGFTLYKKSADGDEFAPVANTNYYLLNADGDVITISSTDANGHFYLKNAQSAKFITDIPSDGVTYYVVEDAVPEGFITPDYNFGGTATGGYDYGVGNGTTTHVAAGNLIPEQIIAVNATANKSYEVTVKGSVEANDSVEFICTNYLNAELPNPYVGALEDIIVIDYGLPVQIDPLANDLFRGDSREIVYVGGADVTFTETENENGVVQGELKKESAPKFGTIALNDVEYAVAEDGTITRDTLVYTLNEQLTEVEVLTYIVEAKGEETQGATGEKLTQYDYAIGKIYIVPATTMYYEENFSDLVTFTGNGWSGEQKEETYVSKYQEPGVVGTTTDSTYGSDVAYLSDSKDSNGTSYKGDTTNGAIRFSYTFTGTGTSFFARTSATTGYMQVKLYEGEGTTGKQINLTYRDTYYEDTNESDEDAAGTLYNIPVYTESDLDYGTYTVVATVAKAGTAAAGGENGSGNEFYLDGIRIMEPLNELIETVVDETTGETITDKALGAYATDGESNMEVITLRQKMITDAEEGITPWNFVVLTDTNGEITTAEEYVSIGPKEEVYLNEGQSVSFGVKYWHQSGYKLYMGMKAPMGSAIVQSGQNTKELKNATDCYYDITGEQTAVLTKYEQAVDEDGNLLYTDANGNEVYKIIDETDKANPVEVYKYVSDDSLVEGDVTLTPKDDTSLPYYFAVYTLKSTDGIVSLTNIKAVGNYEFVIVEDVDVNVDGTEGGE